MTVRAPEFTVTHEQLLAATAPLLDLLGVTSMGVFSYPPITIAADAVEFAVPCAADHPDAESIGDVPESAEWGRYIRVEVI